MKFEIVIVMTVDVNSIEDAAKQCVSACGILEQEGFMEPHGTVQPSAD